MIGLYKVDSLVVFKNVSSSQAEKIRKIYIRDSYP